MSEISKAADIAAEFERRIATIRKDNGFQTDIGRTVFRGRWTVPDEAIPCTVIVEGADVPEDDATAQTKIRQRYILESHFPCDPDHPNDEAHRAIADMKRVIFAKEERLPGQPPGALFGGLVTRVFYRGRTIGTRSEGVSSAFASIVVEVVYAEDLRNP